MGLEVTLRREQVLGSEEPSTSTRANEPGPSPDKRRQPRTFQRKAESPGLRFRISPQVVKQRTDGGVELGDKNPSLEVESGETS